jgi:hypothetical protein
VRWRVAAGAAAGAERDSDPSHTGLSLPQRRQQGLALPGLRSLAGVGGQPGATTTAAGVSPVGWRWQRRVCPDAPHRKRPARPGSNTGNNALPHKKRGGKLSGSSSRVLPSLGPGSFLRSALPRNAVGASVGWRLASRREEASTRSQRQRRQRVFADSFCVLFFGGGPWRPVAFVAVRPPVLFPCAGGQRGCCGGSHKPRRRSGPAPAQRDGAGTGGAETGPATFLDPGGRSREAQRSGFSPWKRSFCASGQDRNGTVSCRGHRHRALIVRRRFANETCR